MERMKRKIGKRKVGVHKMEGLYPYVRLEDFMKVCKGLEKENENLKEKLSEITMVADDEKQSIEHILELEEENKKLKSDLEECECSFGFENDEVGYRKREYKRLKKWIKDHCKGYGNLFPEDEMKRQWKKADKKRK